MASGRPPLTTTATEFFEGRGHEGVQRETVPDAIRETAVFAAVCPSTAAVLVKRL
jgi:amino-acid N-acetyltransferase